MDRKLPQDQTDEEWRHDYDSARSYSSSKTTVRKQDRFIKTAEQSSHKACNSDSESYSKGHDESILSGRFIYIGHKTTRMGRLILEFSHDGSGEIVPMFFNIETRSRKTGKEYPAGLNGQFTSHTRTKFGRFFNRIYGRSPERWSRAHHELSKLKYVSLCGEAVKKSRKDGSGDYWEMRSIEIA